jgi:hypothetical protein
VDKVSVRFATLETLTNRKNFLTKNFLKNVFQIVRQHLNERKSTPESILKKRKQNEKLQAERIAKEAERKKVCGIRVATVLQLVLSLSITIHQKLLIILKE